MQWYHTFVVQGKMIEIPKKQEEKIALVRKLFCDFKADNFSDTRAIKAVVQLLGGQLKERGLWNYKKIWEKDEEYYASIEVDIINVADVELPDQALIDTKIEKGVKDKKQRVKVKIPKTKKPVTVSQAAFNEAVIKANTAMFGKPVNEIKWLDPNREYAPDQIQGFVEAVCNEMTIGTKGFTHILDGHGITYSLWTKWLATDEELMLKYERAKLHNNTVFNARITDAMKQMVMLFLDHSEVVEETVHYEIVKQADPKDPSKVTYVEEPRGKSIKRKPQKPDTNTMKAVIDMLKQMQASMSADEQDDLKKLASMSEAELNQYIQDLEKERENRNAN